MLIDKSDISQKIKETKVNHYKKGPFKTLANSN